MELLMKTLFGSHVYGTSTPASDLDYKAVFIPTAKEILLQTAPRVINETTKKDPTAKNTLEDIDIESFALHEFFRLLIEGQTVTVDMLFTPDYFYQETSVLWHTIREEVKQYALSKKISKFADYCKHQANKYGIKGSRVAAVRDALEILKAFDDNDTVEDTVKRFEMLSYNNEHVSIVNLPNKENKDMWHIEVCDKKMPFKTTVKFAKSCYQKLFDNYGQRALQAEKNEGVDWKALNHAVRVTKEAQELLLTKKITYPRPEASLLLQIRKGELPYKQVAEMLEQGLLDLAEAQKISTLPEEPNVEKLEEILLNVYKDKVLGSNKT